jgi:lysophospholipase L1-like esterase
MRHDSSRFFAAVRRAPGTVMLLWVAGALLRCSTASSPEAFDGGPSPVGASPDGPSGAVDVAGQPSFSGPDGSPPAGGDGAPNPDAGSNGDTGLSLDAGGGAGGDGAPSDAGPLDASGPTGDASAAGYRPCPIDGSNCKVLPLGDSITFGIQFAGAYRVQLFQDAVTDHKKLAFVGDPSLANGPTTVGGMPFPQNNQGHSGWTIDQIKGIVPAPALNDNPDIILLMIGTNDMYSRTQPVAQAPQRLGALLDAIVMGDAHALLVVAQITPLQNATSEANVMTYNAAIPALVSARASAGKHILLVDQHTGFQISTMLSSDGVHPNQTGYNHMGDVWYAAIRDVLP